MLVKMLEKAFCKTILAIGIIVMAGTAPARASEEENAPAREWTVMVYIAGDNNLEEAVIMDLLEMEQGKNDDTEILVFLDRSRGYYQGWQNWHGGRLYRIRKDPSVNPELIYGNQVPYPDSISSEMLQDLGEIDSGNPKVLEEFVKYAGTYFPAKRYAFVGWDHGGGWPLMLQDEGTGHFMSSVTFADALRRGSQVLPSGRFDLVLLDMCLMGQLDALYNLRDVTRYTVASAQIVPGPGADYAGFLKYFHPEVPTRKTGEAIVDASVDFYNKYPKEATFSLYDMSKIDPLAEDLRDLTAKLKEDSAGNTYRHTRNITDSFHYGQQKIYSDFEDRDSAFSSIDLDDWLNHIQVFSPDFSAGIANVRRDIRDFMVYTRSSDTYKFTKGLAVYAPVSRNVLIPGYENTPFARASGFLEYLTELYKHQELRGQKDPFFSDIEIGIPHPHRKADPTKPENFDIEPVDTIVPMSQTAIRFAVNGENILWTTLSELIMYQERPDRIYINHEQLLVDITKRERLDKSLIQDNLNDILPDYTDGKTMFLREFTGQMYRISNGSEIQDITVDHSNTAFDTISVSGYYYSPSLGQEVHVIATFDTRTMLLSGIYHHDLKKEITVSPGGYFRPEVFYLAEENGQLTQKTEVLSPVPFGKNDELFLLLSNIPDGSKIGYLFKTETMGGRNSSGVSSLIPVANSPEQLELINETVSNLAGLKGRYAISYYGRTTKSGLNLLPTFETIAFDFDTSRTPRMISWSNGEKTGIGLLNYLLKPQNLTPPQLILYRKPEAGKELENMGSYELFVGSRGSDRVIYLIEIGSATRIALYPLEEMTEKDLEGTWVEETQKWTFGDHRVTMVYSGDAGEKGTYTGTYEVRDNVIRVNWKLPFKEFCFIIDKNQDRIVLKPREKLLFGGERVIPGTGETASAIGKKLAGRWTMHNGTSPASLEIFRIPGRKYLRFRFSMNGTTSEAVGAISAGKFLMSFSDGRRLDPEYTLNGPDLILKTGENQTFTFRRDSENK